MNLILNNYYTLFLHIYFKRQYDRMSTNVLTTGSLYIGVLVYGLYITRKRKTIFREFIKIQTPELF